MIHDLDDGDTKTVCTLLRTTYLNSRPPLVSRVYRTSRSVAMETGRLVVPEFEGAYEYQPVWTDPVRDSRHLNWTGALNLRRNGDTNPFDFPTETIEKLNEEPTPAGTPSLMIDSFVTGTSAQSYLKYGTQPVWERLGHPVPNLAQQLSTNSRLFPNSARELRFLQMVPEWLVVMRTVIVHCDWGKAVATGLFGPLGDAWVVIVDVCADPARVEALFHLAEISERQTRWVPITTRQDFRREAPEAMKQRLRHHIMRQYRSETLVAAMRPAVMFRLCPRMCNRRTDNMPSYRH